MGWRLGVIRRSIIVVAAVLVLGSTATALQVGDKAPDFTLIGPGGKPVKLADLLGKGPVVIYTFIQAFSAA
jgi:thioredoxin-dependent peroxiredoxin